MSQLRFGIRDLLWAMVVLGLVLGWGLTAARMSKLALQLKTESSKVRMLKGVVEEHGYLVDDRENGMSISGPGEGE